MNLKGSLTMRRAMSSWLSQPFGPMKVSMPSDTRTVPRVIGHDEEEGDQLFAAHPAAHVVGEGDGEADVDQGDGQGDLSVTQIVRRSRASLKKRSVVGQGEAARPPWSDSGRGRRRRDRGRGGR